MVSSESGEDVVHLGGIDLRMIPCHTVTSGTQHPTDLPFHHAADELIPWGLIVAAIRYTRLGGVVKELIILNPEGSIPGFVVGVTVHRGVV